MRMYEIKKTYPSSGRVGRRNSVVGEDCREALEFRDFFAYFLSKRKYVPVEDPGLSGKATSLMNENSRKRGMGIR